MLKKGESKNMKKCFALLFLLAVCLSIVPGSVGATDFDEEGQAVVNCSVGDEFTVNVPTGWSIRSILSYYFKDELQFISKSGGIFSDNYKFKALKPGTTYITILTGKLEYLYDDVDQYEVKVNVGKKG